MVSPANQTRETLLAATKFGARLWRMNVGFGWIAAPEKTIKATRTVQVTMQPGDVLLRQARPFAAGAKGMCDSGGFTPVTITQEMVGQKVAISTWVEDKSGSGRATPEQKAFMAMVRMFGGLAGVARNDDDVRAILSGEIRD